MKNKKILIPFVIILILIIIASYFIYNKYFCYTDIYANNNTFKLTIPNRIKIKENKSDDPAYLLDLYSIKDQMLFYSNVIDKESEIDLNKVVNDEIAGVSKNLQNINLISNATDLTINNFKSCKYTYTYSDSNYGNDFYAEVIWIETDSKIYILDFEVIQKNMDKYMPIFEKIENSFTTINE